MSTFIEKQLKFLANIDIRGDGECWLWKGGKDKGGYGRYGDRMAHRLMYELVYGPIPEGKLVCHDCPGGDNPACCNPKHLWLGTYMDNNMDAKCKGTLYTAKHREIVGSRNRGKHLPEETKRKMSIAHTGKSLSEEHVLKISLSRKGNQVWLGKCHTIETKQKMGEARKRWWNAR